MANHIPKIANDSIELRCACKLGETVIVSTDRNFFVELDEKVSKSNAAKKTKSLGKKGIIAGVALSFFTGGLGLAVIAASALGTVAGVALEKFKDYKVVMDYAEKRVIFLKKHGSNAFDENIDTIEGIDINAILLKG